MDVIRFWEVGAPQTGSIPLSLCISTSPCFGGALRPIATAALRMAVSSEMAPHGRVATGR